MKGKVAAAFATVAVAAAIALGGGSQFVGGACAASDAEACATPSFPSTSSSTGNLWIVTSGGSSSCTRDATPQTLANIPSGSKCDTPQHALSAASGGDTVMIQDGTYASSFSLTSGTPSSAVTFHADGWTAPADADGVMSDSIKVVYTGGVAIQGVDKVHVEGVSAVSSPNTSGSGTVNNSAGDLSVCDTITACTTQNTDVLIQGFHGKDFFGRGSGITVDLSEFGGFDSCIGWVPNNPNNGSYPSGGTEDAFRFWSGAPNATDQMTNDTLKRSVVHDETMGTTNCGSDFASHGPHTDCMQNSGGTNFLIAQNIFFNCPEQDVQWQQFNSQNFSNITVENNYFGPTGSIGTSAFGAIGTGSCSTVDFRYNIVYGVVNSSACSTTNMVSSSNIYLGSQTACGTGTTYDHNIFASAWTTTCGSGTQHCDPSFVNSLPGFSVGQPAPNPLLSGSDTCAKSNGNTGSVPALDFFGNSRPLGTVDAGPSEVS